MNMRIVKTTNVVKTLLEVKKYIITTICVLYNTQSLDTSFASKRGLNGMSKPINDSLL